MQAHKSNSFNRVAFVTLGVITVLLFILNISLGSIHIPFKVVSGWIFGISPENEVWHNILYRTRLPQTITAILAGAGLAVGGLQMQTLFRNPLAGPSILGISSGAGLAVALVIMLFSTFSGLAISNLDWLGTLTITAAAFIGALGTLFVVVLLAGRLRNNAMLLIVGIMVGYASNAIVGVLQFISTDEKVQAYVVWGLGSFDTVSWDRHIIFIPLTILGLIVSAFLIKPLNVLLLGENYATNLGLNIKRARLNILLATGLLTATVTAFCGPIAFLGLAVPHLTKGLFRTADHSVLLPAVAIIGAALALLCHLIARLPGFEGVLPINAVTSLIGSPIVIYVILKKRNLKQ